MKKFRARILDSGFRENFEALILTGNSWRSFGLPFSCRNENSEYYSSKRNAKRGAEEMAKALGIELVWED